MNRSLRNHYLGQGDEAMGKVVLATKLDDPVPSLGPTQWNESNGLYKQSSEHPAECVIRYSFTKKLLFDG